MDETTRLAGLRSLQILDTGTEEDFDRLARLASAAIGTPVAVVSLVDEARVWLKSRCGTTVEQMPREKAFCSTAIGGDDVLVVEDAGADARFASSLAVVEHGVRFYAGAPIVLADGTPVGAVCVLDTKPRPRPDDAQLALLRGLAIAVARLLDLRRELRERGEYARLLQLAEDMAGIGTWRINTATSEVQLSPTARTIYGLAQDVERPKLADLLAAYVIADRMRILALLGRAGSSGIDSGASHDLQLRRFDDGALRDVRVKAKVEPARDGAAAAIFGVFRDVTDEKSALRLLEERRRLSDREAAAMARLASTDDLTGLMNRRSFVALAEQWLLAGEATGLALLDLDHFKAINDGLGHDGGDEVLDAFGQLCRGFADASCRFGRVGGEEFAILVARGSERALPELLEALRRTLAGTAMPGLERAGLACTFSAGLADARIGDDWKALFKRADEALYCAKNQGRNRLAVAA